MACSWVHVITVFKADQLTPIAEREILAQNLAVKANCRRCTDGALSEGLSVQPQGSP
jgi:hypothetical protein